MAIGAKRLLTVMESLAFHQFIARKKVAGSGTNWKQRHAGKIYGVDYGVRECQRRVRQMAKQQH